jgi:hypothetical protein
LITVLAGDDVENILNKVLSRRREAVVPADAGQFRFVVWVGLTGAANVSLPRYLKQLSV